MRIIDFRRRKMGKSYAFLLFHLTKNQKKWLMRGDYIYRERERHTDRQTDRERARECAFNLLH